DQNPSRLGVKPLCPLPEAPGDADNRSEDSHWTLSGLSLVVLFSPLPSWCLCLSVFESIIHLRGNTAKTLVDSDRCGVQRRVCRGSIGRKRWPSWMGRRAVADPTIQQPPSGAIAATGLPQFEQQLASTEAHVAQLSQMLAEPFELAPAHGPFF